MLSSQGTVPRIAVESLTGCAGELLVILENLDKLLPYVRVVSFPFAQSQNDSGAVDITFLEGSVSNPHDLEKLKRIRAKSRWLVAVGNCAVWGCVQKSACSHCKVEDMLKAVYGQDSKIEVLPSTSLDEHVKVDVKLSGCPINATQFLSVTANLLQDHLPYITHKPVCLECKLKENPCVLIEDNLPCLGPVTAAGCGALCPSVGAACYGCWGPSQDAQMDAMAVILQEKGYAIDEVLNRLQSFGAPAKLFERMKFEVKNERV
ncbi:MAG: hypothetical protein K2X27_14885 [Candidatus Obscuribacterales bacterium]|nr:hypothetical protein [Candidatus Obscuribacterales bacterium]